MSERSITQWLQRLKTGEAEALDRLMPLVYDDLRRIARKQLRAERRSHTLSTTALVNEAYIRLSRQEQLRVEDRPHFCAIAGKTMRRVLVDYARTRKRQKRGGGLVPIPLEEAEALLSESEADEMLALDSALERLAEWSPRGAEVVMHRFFGGLSQEESAQLLGVSTKTVRRDWIAARAWLRKEVKKDLGI